ncbi:MAG: DNA primase [Patescibacteria group bacterium]
MDAKDEIKLKLDVAEVIGEYLPLKSAGSGSMKGVCPFHAERTPSFHVSRERQIWKCFGCDKGGDMFTFIMEMEGMTFPEALRHLADKAGVEVPEYRSTPDTDKRDVLKTIHKFAAEYYATCLREYPNGQSVRSYVAGRQIDAALQAKFQLGASPDDWDVLCNLLLKQGYSEQTILDSGLGLRRKSGSGLVDRFRGRLMIPLCDAAGTVIGFTARVLPGAPEDQGKYVNSPETPIYHKGAVLHGLHLAKSGIRQAGEVIIVEGNLDVIASHKAGVENVVGSSGTALTETQLRTLARYTKRLVFCLDDDAAGFAAAKRVVELAIKLQASDPALQFDVRCLVVPVGAGKDPDEIVQRDPAEWVRIASDSQAVIEYYFQKVIRLFEEHGGAASVEARRHLIDDLLPHIARVNRPDERHLYLMRIADATHVGTDVLQAMVEETRSKTSQAETPATPAKTAPLALKPAVKVNQPNTAQAPETQAAALLFGAALRYELYAPAILANVPKELLMDPWQQLYTALELVYNAGQIQPPAPPQTLFSRLRAYLEDQQQVQAIHTLDAVALRIDEIFAGLTPTRVRSEVENHLALFASAQLMKRRKELEAAIRHAELAGDAARLTELLADYSKLIPRSNTKSS